VIRSRFRALPIFWQILALVLGGLVVAQIVSILLIMYLPAPRPDFYTMSEIAEALVDDDAPDTPVSARYQAEPPPQPSDMIRGEVLAGRRARLINRPVADVRIYFEPDQAENFPFPRTAGRGAVPVRHGQPYFFNTVEAALKLSDGRWRVVRTPSPPLFTAWQRRTFLWFGFSALAMLPFAWIFARALTRPIRRLAAAVERLDHDSDAPPVPAEGPSELRVTAQVLNETRRNLHSYVRERTAMIGAIAHDLRTPLARIAFRIERAPPELREAMQQDVEQMREMIATTIAFVRDGAGVGERHAVDLSGLAARLAEQAQGVGAAVAVARLDAVTVSGDRSALERLVQNLIDTAVKSAGSAEVSVRHLKESARLSVVDRGPGIPEGELERMFEPFARADPSRSRSTGGIGLGLAIARSIAVAHGGSIEAKNRRGGGLSVTVELPLAA
jgi:two-component system, OmpR family, sensor kinase